MSKNKKENYLVGYTHGGKFHADDVFSAALLKILFPDIIITRVSSVNNIPHTSLANNNSIIFDIGDGEFDHHAEMEYRVPENKADPYASFGKILRKFKDMFDENPVVSAAIFSDIDRLLSIPVDLADNGGQPNLLSLAISWVNPISSTSDEYDTVFGQCVDFAKLVIKARIDKVRFFVTSDIEVEKYLQEMGNDNIVIMPRYYNWFNKLIPSTAEFVIFPSPHCGFNAQCVPVASRSNNLKCPFPKHIAGLKEDKLSELIPDLTFVHNSQFIIGSRTIEAAVEACHYAQKFKEEKKNA